MTRHHPSRSRIAARFALAAALSLGVGAAHAETVRVAPYGYGSAYGGPVGYGFADEAVRGAYIGAPFSSVPSPNRIVPAPWSYGTYGIPTISGVREAPVAAPSLTVINPGLHPASRRGQGPRILSRGRDGAWTSGGQVQSGNGVSVVTVSVPRR
ncbi:hypothetical protein FV232_07940 [Methylobacterium sp. WL30]|uniref:hypothetical protein n=1 Tax=unclassified Methylobacterium TaxID=2615210 RepID=UPI0011C700B9|nr:MULTISPECIES: hypothetical protein [unclassified Methylobacterium]TXM91346.1 hypothetical protein FV223_15515 [Methylobacterium sp. WL116]TXN27967.1 hypothetical protein FV225_21295 [Methylobacterium sp. WL93]TXN50870.1 hypothetical protein FV227_10125 [Methylobacterium sp. WL119]TXN68729.1 hypothetical protein FV232_07940 [Methylobacterium sp. WL30]